MIVEKGRTIIIADPCHFAKDEDWGDMENGFNYDNYTINLPQFSDYIWINTGFGDGSGNVFIGAKPLCQYELEDVIIKLRKGESVDDFDKLGTIGVDSGCFGVFYYDEVLKYNPDFSLDVGSWCYTIITDFEGVVDYTQLDDSDEGGEGDYCYNYIIGSGNKSICTTW